MMHIIPEISDHEKKRISLQAEKSCLPPGAPSSTFVQGVDMRTISIAVERLLRYSGFKDRARRNCADYRLELNDVYLPDLPVEFDGYTILHLSDLHADGLVDEGEGIVRIINAIPCDLAVLTGDFSFEEADENYKDCLKKLVPIVNSVTAHDGIFGVLGNHDLLEMIPVLEGMGVQVLLNDAVQLQRGIATVLLAGVDDPHYYKCHNLQKALSRATPDQIVILLSHSPEIARDASRCGVDFFLCGHTHGGQICLPWGIPLFTNTPCPRRYLSGDWSCGPMQGYTSRGTGHSLSAARIFCPPEITLHTLHSGSYPSEFFDAVEESLGRWFRSAGHAVYA